ncbi:glyoxalase/Bleomycin resistance /Dioxygenase superfamily protein [Mycobacterium kansasii 732]|nr:glyoxalase/Bleomycin resistance /Dioxygenase superfamily protein [Mycobacterium kansasii 732]MBY0388467.1 VOC family protein [Mycobacterium pseudokansasii]VAZ91500.1 Biphenyl-2,3-diol 1,2-dioxygenase [Mycobacterium pseudokansasii]VAZ92457.1 Biphenyl-2,3-diol 1,2-dioxygenase [Mycobacterium pseudokansasii]
MTSISTSVFGRVHLGYIVIETEKFTDWRRFGRDAIGMHLDETAPGVMRFRLDDNECRFLLQRGPAEDATALGWELDDHSTFDTIEARIKSHGVPVTVGSDHDAALRGVERFVRFPGPNGLTQEMYVNARNGPEPLTLAASGGFVTGVHGMGHVAIATKKPHQMRGYYDTVFDARLSDYIDETISGVKFKIRFLRVNERHHTVAIASTKHLPINPIRTRIQHCNVQVAELSDMTLAYQRVKHLGFDMALSVGQHTNDKELSFYAVTPSGFEWELGWNPIVVDESTWEPTTHQGISIWGHTPEGQAIVDIFERFKVGARSMLHRESAVPELCGTGIPDDRADEAVNRKATGWKPIQPVRLASSYGYVSSTGCPPGRGSDQHGGGDADNGRPAAR